MGRKYYYESDHKMLQEALFLLGYGRKQTEAELKSRYRALMNKYHPDKNNDLNPVEKEMAKYIIEAYTDLKKGEIDITFEKCKLDEETKETKNEFSKLTLEELKQKIENEEKMVQDLEKENAIIIRDGSKLKNKLESLEKGIKETGFEKFKAEDILSSLKKSYFIRIIDMVSLKKVLEFNPKTIEEYKKIAEDEKRKTFLKLIPAVGIAGGLIGLSIVYPIAIPLFIGLGTAKYIIDKAPNNKYSQESKKYRQIRIDSTRDHEDLKTERKQVQEKTTQYSKKRTTNNTMINYHEGNLLILKMEFDEKYNPVNNPFHTHENGNMLTTGKK